MAYLLTTIRAQRQASIHGRKLGITYDDYLVGPKGMIEQIEDEQTTAATSFSAYGVSRILVTGSSQTSVFTLQAPTRPGIIKRLIMHSSSTGCQIVKPSGSALVYGASVSTGGSTCINFLKAGGDVTLVAVSTIAWRMMGAFTSLVSSDALGISFTTST